jgi:hypothetical protein
MAVSIRSHDFEGIEKFSYVSVSGVRRAQRFQMLVRQKLPIDLSFV